MSNEKVETKKLIFIDKETIEVNITEKMFEKISKVESEKFEIKNFKDNLKITGFFNDSKKVNDVCRYLLKIDENKKEVVLSSLKTESNGKEANKRLKFVDECPINSKNITKTIVLILESPHKDEYDKKFIPIAPACGTTGRNIEKEIENVFILLMNKYKLNLNGEYRIIISNPVPFQCSLWNLHKEKLSLTEYKNLRDDVWKKLWEKPSIKEDFEKRIEKYKPSLILNACTKDLKEEINEFLKKIYRNESIYAYEVNHPASWKGYGINSINFKEAKNNEKTK